MTTETRRNIIFQNAKAIIMLEAIVAAIAWLLSQLIGWHTIQLFGGMVAFVGIVVGMIFYFAYNEPLTGHKQRIHGFLSPNMRDKISNNINYEHKSADNERNFQIAAVVIVSLFIGWLLQGF